jgi:hypothetical protein
MVAMTLFAMLGSVVYETVIIGLRSASAASRREDIRQQLASALERRTRDMAVAENVDAARDDRFQFDTPGVNNVDYVYDSATDMLSRDDAGTAQRTLVRHQTTFDFNYFDSAGNQLTTPVAGSAEDTIRVVQVVATVTDGSESIAVATAAYLRNL